MSTPNGPELRIGDSEREAAVAALGDHYAEGRLTKEEYDERAGRAWEARTRSALWPLFADLPRPEVGRPTAPATGAQGRGSGTAARWWLAAGWAPLLLVVLALVVFTHLPLFVLLILVWVLLARTGRHWVCGSRTPGSRRRP